MRATPGAAAPGGVRCIMALKMSGHRDAAATDATHATGACARRRHSIHGTPFMGAAAPPPRPAAPR